MGKLMKARLLNGVLLATLAFSMAWAGATVFDTIKLTGNAIKDSNGTTRVAIGSANAVTGSLTVSGYGAVQSSMTLTGVCLSTATLTPLAANTLIVNSVRELMISSGTGQGAWLKVGAQ